MSGACTTSHAVILKSYAMDSILSVSLNCKIKCTHLRCTTGKPGQKTDKASPDSPVPRFYVFQPLQRHRNFGIQGMLAAALADRSNSLLKGRLPVTAGNAKTKS